MKKIMFNDKYGLTRAVLECRKTQTRRLVPLRTFDISLAHADRSKAAIMESIKNNSTYKVGDEVAVAQAYKNIESELPVPKSDNEFEQKQAYHIYGDMAGWNNKMFASAGLMPHRIKITGLRVERLQDISDEDCMKEGVIHYDDVFGKGYMLAEPYNNNYRRHCFTTPRKAFAYLIGKTCGKGTWESNPYVFVYDFELIR